MGIWRRPENYYRQSAIRRLGASMATAHLRSFLRQLTRGAAAEALAEWSNRRRGHVKTPPPAPPRSGGGRKTSSFSPPRFVGTSQNELPPRFPFMAPKAALALLATPPLSVRRNNRSLASRSSRSG